jgi:hypothetical protein
MKRLSINFPVMGRGDLDPIDALATLLLAAKEDREFCQQVEFLLGLPALQRQSLVNTSLQEMEIRGEPAHARAAFAVLATEEGAAIALRAIRAE